MRERISIWQDLRNSIAEGEYDFFFTDPELESSLIPEKKSDPMAASLHLAALSDLIARIPASDMNDSSKIKEALWPYADAHGRGAVLWPLRYSLSGRAKSPDPFTITSIIGKDAALRRIDFARARLSAK